MEFEPITVHYIDKLLHRPQNDPADTVSVLTVDPHSLVVLVRSSRPTCMSCDV